MKTITIWEVERPSEFPGLQINPKELQEACRNYLDAVEKIETGESSGDFSNQENRIFEAALEALYGPTVWEFINERLSA